MSKTIIYYSSGREDEILEYNVQQNIHKHCGDIPIISDTQFPKELGENICIGDQGASGFNCFRQIQIACKEAKTQFVLGCEADCLYPPDYFTFTPPRDDVCYRDSNLYVMPDKRAFYFKKEEGATHAQIVGREFYLSRLNTLFEGAPDWSIEEMNFPKERGLGVDIFDTVEYYETENPVVQIKTHKGLRYYTHSDRTPIYNLPYWGDGTDFRSKYLYGK